MYIYSNRYVEICYEIELIGVNEMNKWIRTALMTGLMSIVCATAAFAYAPGQRTFKVLGDVLNSDRHAVHLVVEQTIDMKDILTNEAYAKLTTAQQKRINRTEYNEDKGINAERIIATDGEGNVVKDQVSFTRGGYWYTIDHVNKTYDRLPELPGMSISFAETLTTWFTTRPEAGNDPKTGWDYDKVMKNDSSLYFYFDKDTENWEGYQVSDLSLFKVVEVSNVVDSEKAFALPPADYKQVADKNMREYAARLLGK